MVGLAGGTGIGKVEPLQRHRRGGVGRGRGCPPHDFQTPRPGPRGQGGRPRRVSRRTPASRTASSGPGPEWLCLIDLPDTDSIEVDHRLTVDGLLPRIDVVVWVVDPEKYRDASLHLGLIVPLSAYQSQFVFALNQVDRLSPEDAVAVSDDLALALVRGRSRPPGDLPGGGATGRGPAMERRGAGRPSPQHARIGGGPHQAGQRPRRRGFPPHDGHRARWRCRLRERWSRLIESIRSEPDSRGMAVRRFSTISPRRSAGHRRLPAQGDGRSHAGRPRRRPLSRGRPPGAAGPGPRPRPESPTTGRTHLAVPTTSRSRYGAPVREILAATRPGPGRRSPNSPWRCAPCRDRGA